MVNLSRSFKAAKNSIKETHNLLHSLSDMVRSDFKKNLSGLEESLNQRIDEAEKAILESSKAREAMVAGVGTMKKSIEKAQRKFSKNNNLEELRLTLTEIFEDIDRLRLANDKISDDISLVLHPNMSAVEAIERFASCLLYTSPSPRDH